MADFLLWSKALMLDLYWLGWGFLIIGDPITAAGWGERVFKKSYAGGRSRMGTPPARSSSAWTWGRWSSWSCTCWVLRGLTCTLWRRANRRSEKHFDEDKLEHVQFWVVGFHLVWPDWAIYWTLDDFVKPLATINLPKYPTFLGNICKGVKIYHFSSEIIFGQLL